MVAGKENVPLGVQYPPTPRCSQSSPSPRKLKADGKGPFIPSSPVLDLGSNGDTLSQSIPGAPPTPCSPSKRFAMVANIPHTPGDSPSKKNKAAIPKTGISGTPGRGNLFTTAHTSESQGIQVDDEVFGSPLKSVKAVRGRHKKVVALVEGKENIPRPTRTRRAVVA